MQLKRSQTLVAALAFAPFLSLPAVAANTTVANPICTDNTAFFDPTLSPSIDLPPGFTASVFAKGLNFPTGIAFLGDSQNSLEGGGLRYGTKEFVFPDRGERTFGASSASCGCSQQCSGKPDLSG